ncbi:ABC transporter permease [Lujinxingia vulgaris]|nr:ABC transporter permease [Lujinxingia vulgaris]
MTDSQTSSSPPRPEYKTYGQIVWGQFKKYRLSYYSVYGVLALFVIAMIAPVLAMNVPFYMHIPEGVGPYTQLHGTTSFPWFAALFDQNFFDSGVDIFFNFLLFYVPVSLIAWTLMMRFKTELTDTERSQTRLRYIGAVTAVGVVLFSVIYMMAFSQPYVDYASLKELEGARLFFPLIEYSYRDVDLMAVSQGPSLEHFLGTDRQGRDVFTRLIYGTRISLTIGVVAVSIYTAIGLVLGSLAGFFGGRVDNIILRMIEIMMCFPVLFLILTLAGFIEEPSIFHIMLIIGLTGWTGIARLVRGEFLRLRNQDFVQAAIALGFTRARIIFRHVLPNAVQPVFVSATFGVAGAILIEATLSFLGVGPANAPSWGQILTSGRNTQQMTLILSSGFAIFVTISLLNLIGEGLRDATDPKLRK